MSTANDLAARARARWQDEGIRYFSQRKPEIASLRPESIEQRARGRWRRDAHVESGPPISVTYALARDAGKLIAALRALRAWAASKAR